MPPQTQSPTPTPTVRTLLQVEIHQPQPAPPGPPLLGERAKGEGEFPAILDFTSSDATLDRYHEIITVSGWHLDAYRRNPVFQNAHQYGDILFTLGRALITEVRPSPISNLPSSVLFQRVEFATAANPVARIAYALYRDGFLHAVSVGFIPIRWEDGTAQSGFARKYLEQELLEVSAVAIPANPNALALAYKSGSLEKSDLKEAAALLTHLASASCPSQIHQSSNPPIPPATPPIIPITPATMAQLRQLRDLLKHL